MFAQVVGTAGALSVAGSAGAPNADARVVDPRTAQIHLLMDGNLDVTLDPQSLFDVPLDDDGAIRIEMARVRALLQSIDNGKRSARTSSTSKAAKHADVSSAAGSNAIDPAAWAARIELDRERLEFYSLGIEQRAALLRAHAARQDAARPRETDEERRARETEAERQQALEAARAARSEAERLVSEEMARLIGIERSTATERKEVKERREALSVHRAALLGWQRRVRDAKMHSSDEADRTYDALRRSLRVAREQLGQAIDELDSSRSAIPELGFDPLAEVPADIPTDAVRERRRGVAQDLERARQEERLLREERATALLDEVTQLNRQRLSMLPYLSPSKRGAVTGFTEVGLEQAQSESRHLTLILRYHHYVGTGWLRALRAHQSVTLPSAWRISLVAVPWVLAWLAFLWWRRRSGAILALAYERAVAVDNAEQRTAASPFQRLVRFVIGIHRPLEWLLFFGISVWLLPSTLKDLLEVQLLIVILGWPLGGALVVNAINSLATPNEASGTRSVDDMGTLRHRSLSLVGRIVVVFALILVVSARLVGEGTIYSWVLSTCWFSAIPVFLILVRWWRNVVFERVDLVRRKSRLELWILANRSGWKSFFAAMLAATRLFGLGIYKTLRSWLSGFNLARRAHAYLFKRELDRLENAKDSVASTPLNARTLALLAPDRTPDTWAPCPADAILAAIQERFSERRYGVVAIVGDLGSGKSSVVARLKRLVPETTLLSCHHDTFLNELEATVEHRRQEDGAAQAGSNSTRLISLDDVHAIVRPVLGGLKRFDELLSFAREDRPSALWVFSIDGITWQYLKRARDARPLFDEVYLMKPWNDEQIGNLLLQRSAEADVDPIFDDLVEKLPPAADEFDQQEALASKKAGYFRMVWDFVRGNPALALEVWRSSLVKQADETIHVRSLRAPDATKLESLPDSALFVLRAILQMEPVAAEEVALAAGLTVAQVRDVVSYALAHGYVVEVDERMSISWTWLRAVVVLLKRRHLLVNS